MVVIQSRIMNDLHIQKEIKEKFEALFQQHSDVIYRLCLYRTSNEDTAYDLVQETFVRLWKTMSSGKDKEVEKPKQYIYQIARNLIIDYYKRKKTVSLDQLQDKGFDPVASESSAELLTEVSLLKDVIESLEEEFRDVIYMRYIEEMKVKHIAEILGISENLASVRISRGKKMLREKFE